MKQVTIEAHTSAIQLSGNNVLYLHILIFPWEVLHPVPRIFLDVFCQYHRFAWTLFVLVLGNVLFNDALNTFYLRLYGVRHMVKDHSDTREETHIGYSFRLAARVTHTTAFVTPVVEHWLEREIAQWTHPMKDRSDDPSHHERTLLPRSYISLLLVLCPGKPMILAKNVINISWNRLWYFIGPS